MMWSSVKTGEKFEPTTEAAVFHLKVRVRVCARVNKIFAVALVFAKILNSSFA